MSFTARSYEEIVRDLLTTLTGGTVRESVVVPPGESPLELPKLRDRPVRRVSHLEGRIPNAAGTGTIPLRFTPADYELVATDPNAAGPDSIRFRDGVTRPVPGTSLTVNYYPQQTAPVPLTDLNVGSVTRTLVETFARELAVTHEQLRLVYESAFLETATGSSLDKVVALVGARRLPVGHPVVKVRLSRKPNTPGRVTVPANTALTDAKGNRYLTIAELTLEPGESSLDVVARGEQPGTELVAEGALDRLEVLIAGIQDVSNPEPARALTTAEADEALRLRARGALQGTVRGTNAALRFALLSIEGVTEATIVEEPNGVPGEVRVDVAYASPSPQLRAIVRETIGDFRAAGIHVEDGEAARRPLNVRVELTLAGNGLPGGQLGALTTAIEERVAESLAATPPGGSVRRARLSTLALQDPAVLDARIVLAPEGLEPAEELTLAAGEVLDVRRPFQFQTTAELGPGATSATVSALLPLELAGATTLAAAQAAIEGAFDAHLASRGPDSPLDFDGVAAAIRDDGRFVLLRADATVTVESGGRFVQLTDGLGAYTPAPGEAMRRDRVDLDPRTDGG